MFYGSIIFRFLGVLVLFVYKNLIALIRNSKKVSFREAWSIPNYSDNTDSASYEMKCILIGFIFSILLAGLLTKVYL